MLPLAAYADRLSVRPGETIRFKVSNHTDAPVRADLVRVVSADPNPDGPGIVVEPVASAPDMLREPEAHSVRTGSYAVVDMGSLLAGLGGFTFCVTVMPTLLRAGANPIASWLDGDVAGGVAVDALGDGTLAVRVGCGSAGVVTLTVPAALSERHWCRVIVRHDAAARRIEAGCFDLAGERVAAGALDLDRPLAPPVRDLLYLADDPRSGASSFNGRLERPLLFDRPLSDGDIAAHLKGEIPAGLVAGWDFAREIESDRIVDIGPHRRHGALLNAPARAVTGAAWTGREMCWRHAPEQYAAIHFHEDDLEDCGWPDAFAWTLPSDIRSGCYALRLWAGDASENVPFFVVPPKGRPSAKIAVLVSTFTYTVYANHARPEWMTIPEWRAAWREQAAAWNGYPHNPGEHRDYGLSTYNYHPDGSGISISSWHRPMLNVRIGYITYPYPDIRASGLRHYPADSHLTAWLEAEAFDYDVITDWELHHEGHSLLADYPVVLTGTHPEYHTREMLDALAAYRDGGGRFCYLGGNGFYWKIALSGVKDGVIEIRRGEGGIRAWAADPGEYYNQFDGEYGGLWRRNGRPPQLLAGVGFTAQGNFVGSHYRILPDAGNPRVSWMFAGITAETIGGVGLSGHGAAGFELDRTDKRLGTPVHALVVARSENHPPDAPWVLVPEEQLTHITTVPGAPARDLIHADMTFFETAGGRGAVFSTGSITFCGSLPQRGGDNNVGRLMRNVVTRFLDPRPFVEDDGGGAAT